MTTDLRPYLADALLCLADDELILGHRASELCGFAPILEEDIAFANLALDEIGHAALWYHHISTLLERDPETYPDQLAFFRSPSEFRNTPFVELPNGDWAFNILRHYLFDAAEIVRCEALAESADTELAAIAARIRKEEQYHIRHTAAWVARLGLGSEESHHRLQNALVELWPLAMSLFMPLPHEDVLAAAKYVPPVSSLHWRWEEIVLPALAQADLKLPRLAPPPYDRSHHTPHLAALLLEMQSVARLDPLARW